MFKNEGKVYFFCSFSGTQREEKINFAMFGTCHGGGGGGLDPLQTSKGGPNTLTTLRPGGGGSGPPLQLSQPKGFPSIPAGGGQIKQIYAVCLKT